MDSNLFSWKLDRQISKVEAERAMLCDQISKLPPLSHRRIELQMRLKELTAKALKIEQSEDCHDK